MNISDGIRINELHSYHDFKLSIKARSISLPEKKSIRETVPYMNGYYDFSALNGAITWNERTIEYTFDVMADNPQALEIDIGRIVDWLCDVHDVDIFDDTLTRYHWHGSYDTCNVKYDDCGECAEIKVAFVVYPFKIADEPTIYTMAEGQYSIYNTGMIVVPYAYSTSAATVKIGTSIASVPANQKTKLNMDLERGENTVIVTGDDGIEFSFYEEVI